MRLTWLESAAKRLILGLLTVGIVGWLLHLASYRALELVGFDLARWYASVGGFLGLGGPGLRILVYGGIQLLLFQNAPPVLARLRPTGRWLERQLAALTSWVPARYRSSGSFAARVVLALLALLFVLQPTQAPMSRPSLGLRVANLLDGSAAASLVDGTIATANWLTAEPVEMDAEPVPVDAFYATLDDPEIPLMDRWDADLLVAADGDEDLAARLKAITWVESGGRQYALSPTGCAGLMQFCAGTAQDRRYRKTFGRGRVHVCACKPCRVDRDVQIALETDPEAIDRYADAFPCPLTDARFDGSKSLHAAADYVRDLSPDVGDHLLLVYVGYNAGPRVARRLYQRMGQPEQLTIDDLRPHLARALRPTFGPRAERRAAGLLDTHLPKLLRAYDRWRPE